MVKPFSVLVLSDLHVFDPASSRGVTPSLAYLNPVESRPKEDPFLALEEIVAQSSGLFEVDALLCLGDMGDKAVPSACRAAWSKVKAIGAALEVPVLATSGNHDVDSRRKYNGHDPMEVLRFELPEYPVDDPVLRGDYWADHFYIYDRGNARVVGLNTASLHTTSSSAYRGSVSLQTVKKLGERLDSLSPAQVNILICHHHPYRHGDNDANDNSEMTNAQELISLLNGRPEVWTVIHGHKHRPKIAYAGGDGDAPVVFAAGSFSANLTDELRTEQNQFYVVSFFPDVAARLKLDLAVSFRSWNYRYGVGWSQNDSNGGLPAIGGFGCRLPLLKMVDELIDLVNKSSSLTLEQLCETAEWFQYVSPGDRLKIVERIKQAGVQVLHSKEGSILEFRKATNG